MPRVTPLGFLARILWLALPVVLAGIAHMAIVAADLLPSLKVPLDGGRTIRGRRVFGDNKTLRGLLAMPALTALFFAGQSVLSARFGWARELAPFDYGFPDSAWHPLSAGAVYGLGYVVAELPNSFAKRRLDIAPGQESTGWTRRAFVLLDQVDSVAGCLVALVAFWTPPPSIAIGLLVVGTGLHLALNALLWAVGLRKRPI